MARHKAAALARRLRDRGVIGHRRQHGFTFVELIAVVVLLGIVAVGSVQYLGLTARSFADITEYERMAQMGRYSVERIGREVRNALPGSVRVTNAANVGGISYQCLEFIPIDVATGYLSVPVGTAGTTLNIVGFNDAGVNASPTDYRVAVYSLNNCDVYGTPAADCVGPNADRHWFDVATAPAAPINNTTMTLDSAQAFPVESPARRLYLFRTPVAFCVGSNGRVTRHNGYGMAFPFSTDTPPQRGNGGVLLAESASYTVGDAVFSFSDGSRARNGAININLTFVGANPADTYQFNHEVLLQNTP